MLWTRPRAAKTSVASICLTRQRKLAVLLLLSPLVLTVSFGGCGSEPSVSNDWRANLSHADPHIRLEAIYRAGRDNDASTVPLLIARLDDDDATVRFAANFALKRITGQDMGFKAYDDLPARREAIRKWQEWFEREHKK